MTGRELTDWLRPGWPSHRPRPRPHRRPAVCTVQAPPTAIKAERRRPAAERESVAPGRMRPPAGAVWLLPLSLLALPLVLAGISSCPPLRPDSTGLRRCLQLTRPRSSTLRERLVASGGTRTVERQRAGRGRRESHCISDSGSPELRLRAVCPFQVRAATFGDVDPVQLQVARCLCTNDSCGPRPGVHATQDARRLQAGRTRCGGHGDSGLCLCDAAQEPADGRSQSDSLGAERPFAEPGAGRRRRRRRRLARGQRQWQRLWPQVEAIVERVVPATHGAGR